MYLWRQSFDTWRQPTTLRSRDPSTAARLPLVRMREGSRVRAGIGVLVVAFLMFWAESP